MSSEKTVRIGCHSGFWGDSAYNANQLVEKGNIDYLVSDYLAETTMSIMGAQMMRNPEAGYAPDFIKTLQPLLKQIKAQGIKVITNAGGINSQACRDALMAAAAAEGVELNVALVEGDNLMARAEEIRALGVTEMGSGSALPQKITSMNAYIGSPAIQLALDAGAEIVICGRCTDSAVVVGALMHEFGWGQQDNDLISSACLAGHVLECVQQAVGGNFTDWDEVDGWDDMGLPIAEVKADGSFIVSKPENTGGLVSVGTVSEQIMYEMGDPQAYLLPDVVCDFSEISVTQLNDKEVEVKGAKGRDATPTYKVSATYMDGYKIIATMMIGGRNAAKKARKQLDAIVKRTRRLIIEAGYGDYDEVSTEVIGAEDTYGANSRIEDAREVILKVGLRHAKKEALEIFSTEFVPAGISMGQGSCGVFAGRPRPSPVIRHFAFLLDKKHVAVTVDVNGDKQDVEIFAGSPLEIPERAVGQTPTVDLSGDTIQVPLIAIAWGRSGDKGDGANIGLIAREPEFATIIREQISTEVMKTFFAHYNPTRVRRWEMPSIFSFNYIIDDVLGGGGAGSLRYDTQGKTYAQMFLDQPVTVPAKWAATKPRIARFADELNQ
ncbi:MAG: DUF1446 domain-containing protein [Halieaceae bacterium]|nr:DUF1446 domain-containing protein [Halieaceae bacterium]